MNFQSYSLGQCCPGDSIKVSLKGNAANVKLMDKNNFTAYKNGTHIMEDMPRVLPYTSKSHRVANGTLLLI